ncbi:Uncharacterised protein [Sphingobacterium spiritivorum]|uniref:Uncharacterized protein n=1 Tax=Sphingobacterium spiritivorum ATCC 33861 TaxID=525373 RepID=D7VKC7_SPHSI|nr:hypothetical protein HMPREF0766_11446 [Sphingobacterium spiritivorum ATCC 33861]SUI99719.1 Uncharacterised protein [Sphingobacterium spiritivorum]
MKAIHNLRKMKQLNTLVVVNIIKSKNESNSQLTVVLVSPKCVVVNIIKSKNESNSQLKM